MAPDAQTAGQSSGAPAPAGGISPGTELAGGYRIDDFSRSTPLADVYVGTRLSDQEVVSLHVLDPSLHGASIDAVRAAVADAVKIKHKNVAATLELVTDGDRPFLVTELLEGHNLRELLARKRETGAEGFSDKGAGNVLAHLCNALSEIGPKPHGAVTLDTVYVNNAGRVKLTCFGLWPVAAAAAKKGIIEVGIAPEVVKGKPTPLSDLYGAGAVLYEILVGVPPVKGCPRPSEALPDTAQEVDMLIGRSMSPAPAKRYPDAATMKKAVTIALSRRPSGPQAAQPEPKPQNGANKSLAASLSARPSMEHAAVEAEDLALDDDEEKWLISKGKLDYGPFTLQAVVEQIRSNGILPGHWIVDKDTGDRVLVEDHPLLTDIVDAAKERRDEMRRANAEIQHAKQERTRGTALYVFILAGVIALGGGVYLLVAALSGDDEKASASVSSLEEGTLQAKFNFPTKEEQRKRRAKRRGKGKSGAGGMSGGWDDSLDLDMSDGEGGSERLDQSQINPVIQKHGGRLGGCLSRTGERYADIDFIIKGTGKVSSVRVNGQTGTPLANCVRGAMKSMTFPSFDGPRTKANFNMSL